MKKVFLSLAGLFLIVIMVFFSFGLMNGGTIGGTYSNEIEMNISYLDSEATKPSGSDFQYNVHNEETKEFPVSITDNNQLTLNYNIEVDSGYIQIIINDENNDNVYSSDQLTNEENTEDISLEQGNYDITLIMAEGNGEGSLSWEGIE